MTIKQARKFLGKLSENVSDDQIEQEIKMAQLLKTIFFSHRKSLKHAKKVYTGSID